MRRSASIIVALVFALAVASVAGCSPTSGTTSTIGPVQVDATADGTTVELAQGTQLVVELEGNPSTGFDWKVAGSLPAQLTAKSDSFEETAATGVVGAGGLRVFVYTAATTGAGVLDLEYVRAWEKGVPPQRTFRLTVVVK